MTRAAAVRIVEVGPRDGLQNEPAVVPVATRIALINALTAAGLETIEAGSFVSARQVPQMAGTDAVLGGLSLRTSVAFPVLVPNQHGLAAAMAAGARTIAVFASASETFSRRNINRTIGDSLDTYRGVAADARAAGIAVRGYVSCVLGCPYEGDVPIAKVVSVASALIAMGCYEVSLGDTIGVGTPDRAHAMAAAVAEEIGAGRVALHFHDTYGQALANVLACLDLGIATVDASVAGLGGCPFAPGASGNLATEDLVYMLDGVGVMTGVDLGRLAAAGEIACSALGIASRSRAGRAFAARHHPEELSCSTA